MRKLKSLSVSAQKTQNIENQILTKSDVKKKFKKTASAGKIATMEKKNFLPKLYTYNQDLNRAWFIFYRHKGKSYQIRGDINSFNTVEERFKAADLLMDQILLKMNNTIYSEMEVRLREAVRIHILRLSRKTGYSYNTKVGWFIAFLKTKKIERISQITEGVVSEFFNSYLTEVRNLKNGTYNGYLTHLSCIWRKITPKVKNNPFLSLKKLPDTSNSYPPFQKFQKKRILEYCAENEKQLYFFILFMRNELSRPHTEARLVKIGDIDFDRRLIFFESERNKNRRQIWKLIPDDFYQFLMEHKIYEYPETYYLFGKEGKPSALPHNAKYFADKHQRILRKLGIDTKKYKLRCWRPDATIEFLEAGFSTVEVKEHGGWQSVEMVERYAQRIGFKPNSRIKQASLM